MRAILASAEGPVLGSAAEPQLSADRVIVEVRAACLNRYDLKMSRGATHGSAGGIGVPFGMEFAGVIHEVGASVDRWRPGDRVMGTAPGAFAERVSADPSVLYSVPDELNFVEAASLPVGLQTMHDALVARGRFRAGDSVLIHGASSGMGIIGMQIARRLGASSVIGTSTTAARRSRLGDFGADAAVDSSADGWENEVLDHTGGDGVDVVLDLVAGRSVPATMRATKIGGCVVNIGRVAGESGEVDFDLHSMRRITYVGTTFRTRSPQEVADVVTAASDALLSEVAAKHITIPVEHVFDYQDAFDAFELMARNEHFGKVVIAITSEPEAEEAV